MAPFRVLQQGEDVRIRGERWRVAHVAQYDACSLVEVAGTESSNAGSIGRFIVPFEPIDRVPQDVDLPRVVRPAVWRRIAATTLANGTPAWWSLRCAARAGIVLLPYQLEPAIAMTRGVACRFLLADEVGLGKTIQAGMLIAELVGRERDARVLIVTPASLREQWHQELADRFAINASVIDAAALARAAADLPAGVNPWAIPSVAITSIDFLKRAEVVRSLEPLVWDLVAFDEAHLLCGRSDRALAADLLAARARRVVIITATPHSGDEGAFERLRALGQLGPGDELLTFRRSRIDAGVPHVRVMRQLLVSPTLEEARVHRALAAYVVRVSRDAPDASAARLAMIVLGRRASSSVASLARSIERRIALLGASGDVMDEQLTLPLDEGHLSEDDEPSTELAAPGLRDTAAEHRLLEGLLALARAVRVESKIAALRRLLRRTSEPALVFTEYRDTLRHVAAALEARVAILHGGLTTKERASEARRFTHGDTPLLLATDAASEGLNLHRRCRLVINLDVPWTPLRLEQRVGRVDRLGQQRRVHAITFVARGTSETRVAAALASRATRAEHSAPFGSTGNGSTDLQADARAEVARLTLARTIAGPGRLGLDTYGRPVLTLLRSSLPPSRLRRRGAPRRQELMLAIRLTFLDRLGAMVWDTVKGFTLDDKGPFGRDADAVRRWFAQAIRDRALPLSAVTARVHDADLSAVRRDIRAAVAPLLSRERALLERINGGNARLAAPLLQPGLFDRRVMREAVAQRRIRDEAAERACERIELLERSCDVRGGERHLLFAVTWWR